ncbi:hypothetical protein [Pontiella sp.]|uniref:hypothetical protein n=1 Tax=Pontiella sp. TaxID=2837462 RepID=UPI00356A7B5E
MRGAMLAALLSGTLSAQALETAALLPEGPSRALLESKRPIYCETAGVVPVDFDDALRVFSHPDLMSHVQAAYAEQVLEEGEPEFSIQQTAPAEYFYVNRKGERTDLSEVVRIQTSETTFDLILYSTGKRFFGSYEALIHVRLLDCGNAGVGYAASVYAYPENAVSRFFARHLGLVTNYFNKKTARMTEMITLISRSLCEEATARDEAGEKQG